jgi:NAD(P)H-hydrate repair Nnr-like enzyme with NAD(P)H-hydrate epimerase domain
MSTIPTLTLTQYSDLFRAWRDSGVTAETQIERAADALANCAVRVALPNPDLPIVVLAGSGKKGAVGMAAVRLLAEREVSVRLVLADTPARLSPSAAAQYQILIECGIQAWGLSMSQAEIDTQEPIQWLSVALFVDALLEADITADPDGEVADLIRMVNATRRPILSYEVPSGVSSDEGYILSPCITANQTLAIALPLRSGIEAAPVAGDVWLADVGIPSAVWEAIGIAAYPLQEPLVNLGTARALRQ